MFLYRIGLWLVETRATSRGQTIAGGAPRARPSLRRAAAMFTAAPPLRVVTYNVLAQVGAVQADPTLKAQLDC